MIQQPLPPLRRVSRAAVALAAAGSALLLVAALGLWGRSYGTFDEVRYARGNSVVEEYHLGSTDGSILWWSQWLVPTGPLSPMAASRFLAVAPNATFAVGSYGMGRDELVRFPRVYGSRESAQWMDSRLALKRGWLGFYAASGQADYKAAGFLTCGPPKWGKRVVTVPWWAAAAAFAALPAAWVVARRRVWRVPRYVRALLRPGTSGVVCCSAACAIALGLWVFTLFFRSESGVRILGRDLSAVAYGGGVQFTVRPSFAVEHPAAPNPPHALWYPFRQESDVPMGRGLAFGAAELGFLKPAARPMGAGDTRAYWPLKEEFRSGSRGVATSPTALDPPAHQYDMMLPLLWPAGVFAVWPLAAVMRGAAAWGVRRRRKEGHCAACGYDLRGSPGRCPECGRAASEAVAKPPLLPLPILAAVSLLLAAGLANAARPDAYFSGQGYDDKTLLSYGAHDDGDSPALRLILRSRDGSLWLGEPTDSIGRQTAWSDPGEERETSFAGFRRARRWTEEEVDPPAEWADWTDAEYDAWRTSPAAVRVTPNGWAVAAPVWAAVALLLVPLAAWAWRARRRGSTSS